MAGFRVRPLPFPELRKDPVVDRWVIVSTERGGRPIEKTPSLPSQSSWCPFCEGQEHDTPGELLAFRSPGSPADGPGWWVRVVPNRFPAVRLTSPSAFGAHEVFIECPRHERDLARLPVGSVCEVFESYRQRLAFWRADGRLAYGQLFKNVGAPAGASLEHSHAQLIVLPMVPSDVRAELDAAKQHHIETRRCVFCDLMRSERESERFVARSEHFTAFAPYASRFAWEVWVFPDRHDPHFDAITPAERDDLAGLVRLLLRRLGDALPQPDYNLVLHTAPFSHSPHEPYHWHLEILPRTTQAAGFEWGTGFAINPVPPEQAAMFYRGSADDSLC